MPSAKRLQAIGTIVSGAALGVGYYYSAKASEIKETEKTKRQDNRVELVREGMEYMDRRREEKSARKEELKGEFKGKVARAKGWLKGKKDESNGPEP
jgi:hypothetical protein